MWKLLLLAMPLVAQDLDENFEKMLVEVNRGRYDKALFQVFPVQAAIRSKLNNKFPQPDRGLMARMREMDNTSAVLSTIALLRSQIQAANYEDANSQAMLLGFGLTGLWNKVPAYQKLNYARQDVAEAPPVQRNTELKKLGYAAIDAQEWELALKTAAELVVEADKKDFQGMDPGSLKHSALTVRGLALLGQGDTTGAEKALLDSMKVRGENMMRMSGPSFRLASALLAKGRRTVVDQFLVLVSESVWKDSSKADQWRKDLAAGKEPDLPRFSIN